MTNRLIDKLLRLITLGVALTVWVGCGADEADAPDKQTTTVNPTGGLKGQVEAIEAVQIDVQVLQNNQIIASTEVGADGSYRIDRLKPGTYTVHITAEGYESQNLTVQITPDQTTSLGKRTLEALKMPVAQIRGFLSDQATKEALESVHLQLIGRAGEVWETVTTKTGGFVFEDVPTDEQFTLIIDHEGYQKQEIEINPIPAGETEKITAELVPLQQEGLPVGDGLTVGTKAPDFSLPDENGKVRSLADYAGQKVLLVFDRGRW